MYRNGTKGAIAIHIHDGFKAIAIEKRGGKSRYTGDYYWTQLNYDDDSIELARQKAEEYNITLTTDRVIIRDMRGN